MKEEAALRRILAEINDAVGVGPGRNYDPNYRRDPDGNLLELAGAAKGLVSALDDALGGPDQGQSRGDRADLLRVFAVIDETLGLGPTRKFDPNQPRDPKGKWSKLAGAAKKLAKAVEGAAGGEDHKGLGGSDHHGPGFGKSDPTGIPNHLGDFDIPGPGATEHGGHGPLTDQEFEARKTRVESVVAATHGIYSTDHMYTDGNGVWDQHRNAMHHQVATELYAKASAGVPTDGRAVIAGGLGGAGKSTVLKKYAGIDPTKFVTVNPDDIKEELARRQLIPPVPGHPDLSPMERASLVHEESSRIAGMMAKMAYAEKRNMIWDITMSSDKSVKSRVEDLRKHGYTAIEGVFVDIPVEVSVERAMLRYRSGVDDYRNGKGYGGRFVPPKLIRSHGTSTGSTINRGTFDKMRDIFDMWSVFDNSRNGQAPVLVEKKG